MDDDKLSSEQPLISKPSYPSPFSSSSTPPSDHDEDTSFPLITYNSSPRHFQDLPFLILFFLFFFSTFAFGLFSVFHRNPNSGKISSFVYSHNTSSCVQNVTVTLSDSFSWFLHEHSNTESFLFSWLSDLHNSDGFIKDLVWTVVVTVLLSAPMVMALLYVLKHFTKQIVYATIPFFVLIPIFFNVYWFVACTLSDECSLRFLLVYRIVLLVFVFLVIGVIVWIIVANWGRIELTVKIVRVSSDALSRNLGLFVVLPMLTIGLVVYFVPIVVFMVFSRLNGKIVPHLSKETETYSCAWKEDSWVPAYFALAIITMLWSAAAIVEAQVYVISGTIAQWYFSKEFTKPRRSIRTSLRNAFGPSSGTICFSGLLILVVRVVRAAVDSARREEDISGIVHLMLRCCVNALLSAIDFLNKFTINFAAITGEAYCSSAKMTYELLKRNLLSAVFVETVSTRILAGMIFVLSAIYAIAVCAILKAVTYLGAEVYFVAVVAGLLLLLVLGFFVHVLDNVIDTVYVCYAVDKDKGEVCKQEVHEVYVYLPISRNQGPSFATRTPLIV